MLASSLTQALSHILYGPEKASNQNVMLLDYRDRDTFKALWFDGLASGKISICGQEFDLSNSEGQFLIIGNAPPDGIFETNLPGLTGINIHSHFSATSWLAAWRIKQSGPVASIAVIDPRPSSSAGNVVQALQTLFSAKDGEGTPLFPNLTVLDAPSLKEICSWLSNSREIPSNVTEVKPQLTELLRSTIWNELTSDRERHHALSNVLGAFLLSVQVGKGSEHPGEPWAQDYLLALVQALGVQANLEPIGLQEERSPFHTWITSSRQKEIEGTVLIDDMANLWAYFLRGATGFVGGKVIDSNSERTYHESLKIYGREGFLQEIAEFPTRLKHFFETKKPLLTAGDILDDDVKLGENFVLFLDLRLFPTSNQNQPVEAERLFFKQLRDFGHLLLDSKRNLPWADEYERKGLKTALDHWAEDKWKESNSELAPRETLLPRLVALLDPTLPIVIFSSTHRTELIEPFRGYGNIITYFHKPVVNGFADDWSRQVAEIRADFEKALNRAADILRVRKLLRPFQKNLLQN